MHARLKSSADTWVRFRVRFRVRVTVRVTVGVRVRVGFRVGFGFWLFGFGLKSWAETFSSEK